MPKIVDREKKSAEIAAAGLRSFCELGYHQARMVDIAATAGIGKGTLYEYFPDKAAILRHGFDEYFESFRTQAMRTIAAVDGPGAQLLALVDFALEHLEQWEDHCAVYVDYFALARTDPEGPFSLSELYAEFRGILGLLVQQGQAAGEIDPQLDPAATADLLVSIYDGVILHGVLEDRPRDPEALRATTRSILAHGLLRRPTPEREGEVD